MKHDPIMSPRPVRAFVLFRSGGGPEVHKIEIEMRPPPRASSSLSSPTRLRARWADRIRAALGREAAPYWLGTFHGSARDSFALRPKSQGFRPGFDILDADDSGRTIKRMMMALDLAGDQDACGGRDPVKAISNEISSFKDRLMTPEAAAAQIDAAVAASWAKRRVTISWALSIGEAQGSLRRSSRTSRACESACE